MDLQGQGNISVASASIVSTDNLVPDTPLASVADHSNIDKVIKMYKYVFKFINNMKTKLFNSDNVKYSHFKITENEGKFAVNTLVKNDLCRHYPDVVE